MDNIKLDRIKLDQVAGKLTSMYAEPVRVAIYLNLNIPDYLITNTSSNHGVFTELLNNWLDNYYVEHNEYPTEQLLRKILSDMGINPSLCM